MERESRVGTRISEVVNKQHWMYIPLEISGDCSPNSCLTCSHWGDLNQDLQISLVRPHNCTAKIIHCCFKSLMFGVVSNVEVNNWNTE